MKYLLDGKLSVSIDAENTDGQVTWYTDTQLETKNPGTSAALQAYKEGIQRFLLGHFWKHLLNCSFCLFVFFLVL